MHNKLPPNCKIVCDKLPKGCVKVEGGVCPGIFGKPRSPNWRTRRLSPSSGKPVVMGRGARPLSPVGSGRIRRRRKTPGLSPVDIDLVVPPVGPVVSPRRRRSPWGYSPRRRWSPRRRRSPWVGYSPRRRWSPRRRPCSRRRHSPWSSGRRHIMSPNGRAVWTLGHSPDGSCGRPNCGPVSNSCNPCNRTAISPQIKVVPLGMNMNPVPY